VQHILNFFCDILMPPLVRWAVTGISKIVNALFRRTRQASTEASDFVNPAWPTLII
jgi:hypothetical protein